MEGNGNIFGGRVESAAKIPPATDYHGNREANLLPTLPSPPIGACTTERTAWAPAGAMEGLVDPLDGNGNNFGGRGEVLPHSFRQGMALGIGRRPICIPFHPNPPAPVQLP